MIYDTLENLPRYRGIHKNLDTAIDFLMQADLSALPVGRNEVDGNDVYVNVMDATYRTQEEARFEAHRDYADIQISLTGGEQIGWLPVAKIGEWNPQEENPLFEGRYEPELMLPLEKGYFALLLPQDAHAPAIGCGTGHKLVGKVKVC